MSIQTEINNKENFFNSIQDKINELEKQLPKVIIGSSSKKLEFINKIHKLTKLLREYQTSWDIMYVPFSSEFKSLYHQLIDLREQYFNFTINF